MIVVYVKYADDPSVRGTAFARDWTELYWVIDQIFGDPITCLIAPHDGYGAICVKADLVDEGDGAFWEPDYTCLQKDAGPYEAYGLTPLDDTDFIEMDWDYVRTHNQPPARLREHFGCEAPCSASQYENDVRQRRDPKGM